MASVGLMGFALGALQGVQQIQQRRMLEEAEARKEERLQAIRERERKAEQEFRIELMGKEQGFREAERIAAESARSSEAERQREWQSEERAADRASMEKRAQQRAPQSGMSKATKVMVTFDDDTFREMTLGEAQELDPEGIKRVDSITSHGSPKVLWERPETDSPAGTEEVPPHERYRARGLAAGQASAPAVEQPKTLMRGSPEWYEDQQGRAERFNNQWVPGSRGR